MKTFLTLLLSFLVGTIFSQNMVGFFPISWDDGEGKMYLKLNKNRLGDSFLYVNSLSAGIGSNDIGLDRGQLGKTRIVKFEKRGGKILLIQDNVKYKAVSENNAEKRSMQEAFAKSVLHGFKFKVEGDAFLLTMDDFLLRDAHDVIGSLSRRNQGSYSLDKSKSDINLERTRNFPENTEMDVLLTFTGKAKGREIRNVSPSPNFITVQQHHSFIKLPDDQYQPRAFHPAAGYIMTSFYDYAKPIGEDLKVRYINRHRLIKKNPNAARSEAVEPIIYYLDPGTPEPVRSALLEGAQWWNQAFEEAGFINGFQIKILPEDADPMDIRYNVIQWVHRSTRGWSYGASVVDPRTGEILKGHVSLGSLRVRQDYMIAQGILSSFKDGEEDPRILEMALARLRQLSAHEVGHTIGLTHNFTASVNDRASVMDYPHPLIESAADGSFNLKNAYAVGIGEWDKQAIVYGYGSADNGQSEQDFLKATLAENKTKGLLFISDTDARPKGGAHPQAHLWDNGKNPTNELRRIMKVRANALENFNQNAIKDGQPFSELEKVLMPLYLMHRYQVDAASKLIGGIAYQYAVKGEDELLLSAVAHDVQKLTLQELLKTTDIDAIKLPTHIINLISPQAFGYNRDRETSKGYTGLIFDPLALAEANVNNTFSFLLDDERLARLNQINQRDWNLNIYLMTIVDHVLEGRNKNFKYAFMKEKTLFIHLLKIAFKTNTDKQVKGMALYFANDLLAKIRSRGTLDPEKNAHNIYLAMLKNKLEIGEDLTLPTLTSLPPGSPIGCY